MVQLSEWCHLLNLLTNKKIYIKVFECIFVLAFTVSEILMFQFFTFNKYVKDTEYNFHDDVFRWKISQSTKVVACIFVLALTISELLVSNF